MSALRSAAVTSIESESRREIQSCDVRLETGNRRDRQVYFGPTLSTPVFGS